LPEGFFAPKTYETMKTSYLCVLSLETVSFFLPLRRRAAKILRPLAVAILSLKPCLFLLLRCDGWNVLFISQLFAANVLSFFKSQNLLSATFHFEARF
jgi:hypothetical protein